jgi:hypothetical protein
MAVVVNDRFLADALAAHDEAGGAEGTETDDRLDDALARDVHGLELEARGRKRQLRAGAPREQGGQWRPARARAGVHAG